MKPKTVNRRKPQSKALVARKDNSKWSYDPARRRPASFAEVDARGRAAAPELDPHTRHALVTLAESVDEFRNLEGRIGELAGQVTQLENKAADVPEGHWRSLQNTVSLLQRDFKDRVTALERQAGDLEMVMSRMDRLEKRLEDLAAAAVKAAP